MRINRSLAKASHFAGIDPVVASRSPGGRAWVQRQERGVVPASLSPGDREIYHRLEEGWQMASLQVLMWIDEIALCMVEGHPWYWFWEDVENETDPVLKAMLRSLAKSIRQKGMFRFLTRHPQFSRRPLWKRAIEVAYDTR